MWLVLNWERDKNQSVISPPPVRKRKLNLKVGYYVSLHESKLETYHIPCRVVQMFGDKCVLYCRKGVKEITQTQITKLNTR